MESENKMTTAAAAARAFLSNKRGKVEKREYKVRYCTTEGQQYTILEHNGSKI